MATTVNSKGTIRNILRGIDDIDIKMLLYEMIDDAEHSKSKKIFIDFNLHENRIIIGYEKKATIQQMNSLLMWNDIKDKDHSDGDLTIATCAQGSKFFLYHFRGETTIISKTDNNNVLLESGMSTAMIYDDNIKPINELNNDEFVGTLSRCTTYPRNQKMDDLRSKHKMYFDGSKTDIPFSPEMIIYIDDVNKENIEKIKNKDIQSALIKSLNSKYYYNIKYDGLDIFIKYPDSPFKKLDGFDTVGIDHKKNEFIITICKANNEFIIKYKNNYYTIKRNGNSILRTLYTGETDKIQELYLFKQFIIDIDNKKLKENINGKSGEEYSGIYLQLGNYIINDLPVKDDLTKRNLPGSSSYRGIFTPLNTVAKDLLQLKGLKASFDLTNMVDLNKIFKQCIQIYKHYNSEISKNPTKEPEPKDFLLIENSNKNKISSSDKQSVSGHYYIMRLGEFFWKSGITTGGKKNGLDRIKTYGLEQEYNEIKKDYPDEILYDIQDIEVYFLNVVKYDKIHTIEAKALDFINEHTGFKTYAHKKKDAKISEFFHCSEENALKLKKYVKSYYDYN